MCQPRTIFNPDTTQADDQRLVEAVIEKLREFQSMPPLRSPIAPDAADTAAHVLEEVIRRGKLPGLLGRRRPPETERLLAKAVEAVRMALEGAPETEIVAAVIGKANKDGGRQLKRLLHDYGDRAWGMIIGDELIEADKFPTLWFSPDVNDVEIAEIIAKHKP